MQQLRLLNIQSEKLVVIQQPGSVPAVGVSVIRTRSDPGII